MQQIRNYIHTFFASLNLDADTHDLHQKHHYKEYLQEAVERFLGEENKDTAYDVYRVFLECYGYSAEVEKLNFIEFVEKMRGYEENAAVLVQKQRDHFVHSVNVFLMGLSIYQCSITYRESFYHQCFKNKHYPSTHDSPQEEFFFRWGMASLCHDIGYPIEIITNQVNDFINFTACLAPGDPQIHAHVEYDRFDLINAIPEKIKKCQFVRKYYDQHEECVYIDLLKPVDLLAHKLHQTLGVDLRAVKERLDGYVAESGRSGCVDHGFFSAVILLKWCGYLIQAGQRDPGELYYPLLDIASAVLLHNFFGIALVANTKRPNSFNLPPLEPDKHPLGYLLILCDELQEWNREPYGREDKLRISIESADVSLDEQHMAVTYIITKGAMPEEFIGKKVGTLNSLLDLNAVFPGGISIGCDAYADAPAPPQDFRLSMVQLERLAIAIHNRYNQTALRLDAQKKIEFVNFADLPKEKKFYNFRSAMEYPMMLAKVGCELRTYAYDDPERVTDFTPEEIEMLAECEHDRWMRGRIERGWHFGVKRSTAQRTNPFMIPYADLPETIKEFDRDPARNLPELVSSIGLGVYRRAVRSIDTFSPDEIDLLARRIHQSYNERAKLNDPSAVLLTFEDLTEEKRESNRRQARGIPNKLRHIGCRLLPLGTQNCGKPITDFPLQTVEMLARVEHDEWMGEKIQNGWVYGPRDDSKKCNPYIVDYFSLEESIKEYDRDSVRRIPRLVNECGYGIFPAEYPADT